MWRPLAAAWALAGLLLATIVALVDVPRALAPHDAQPRGVDAALILAALACAALALHAAWLESRGRAVVAWRVLPALTILLLYATFVAAGSSSEGVGVIVGMLISPLHWGYLLLGGTLAYALVLGLRALARRVVSPRTGE